MAHFLIFSLKSTYFAMICTPFAPHLHPIDSLKYPVNKGI